MIAPRTSISARPHRVTFENPGAAVPDGDGAFTQSWTALAPAVSVEIRPARAADLERLAGGATLAAVATHLITGLYRPDVTTRTRILSLDAPYAGREFHIASVLNPDGRGVEMVLFCMEGR